MRIPWREQHIAMQILYNATVDLLYLRLDDRPQEVVNQRVSDDMVLDIGADGRIVGIEILDASRNVNLTGLLPLEYAVTAADKRS
jgi:uncharacterized protein YuzE